MDYLAQFRRSGWGGDDAKQYQMDEDRKNGPVPSVGQPTQTQQNTSDAAGEALAAMKRKQQTAGGGN
jgi:hypothetical protein